MSSDDSNAGPHHKRKRKLRRLEESPPSTSSSGSPIIGSSSSRARRRVFRPKKHPAEDSSDSDSGSISLIPRYSKRKKVGRVASDTDSQSSGSTIVKRTRRTGRIVSDVDSDRGFEGSSSSQWETDVSGAEDNVKPEVISSSAVRENYIDSDSSDGQSEKCPICLLSFKLQEIGTPESCDHMFCLECLQEWSKNMNTCPIDRQEYHLILVRKNMLSTVTRQIPIEKPSAQNDFDIVEDPTFCEICGTCFNEDRMLLCDGCDLGFHLYCLTPRLEEIPAGAWFCNDCSPDDDYTSEIELNEIQLLLDDAEGMERPQGRRRNLSARLIPRTRQSERVRRRIEDNRQHTSMNSSTMSRSIPEASYLASSVSSSSRRPRKHKKSKKRRSPKVRYKTVYEVDEGTGETIAVRKRQTRRGKAKKSKRRRVAPVKPRTVKKRLATHLGICAPRAVPQNLPDVKVQNRENTLVQMRWQAGIPTLRIFGHSNDLDYFSGGDDENYEGGSQLLTRRAPTLADASALRRLGRRKAAITVPSVVSSSTDLLDSILSSQEQFHSRNVMYSVDSAGRFKMEQKYVDVTKQNTVNRQRPNFGNQGSENNSNFNRMNPNSYHSHSLDAYHSTPTSTMESAGTSTYSGGEGDRNEVPQDYTQRTLCASSEGNQERKDKDEENTGTNTPNSESEIDIYSDIETVSTSKVDESDPRPPSPPVLSNTPNTDCDDNNDSEPDMVIDDDKAQECDKMQEETAVTSTVGCSGEFLSAAVHSPAETLLHSSMEIQSGAIQSSNLTDIRNHEDEEDSTDGCPNTSIYSKESIDVLKDAEDVDSDDGCPNFSIYSKESKSVALHTDISLSAEDNTQTQQEYQVGEISSSPNVTNQEDFLPQSPQNRDEGLNYAPELHQEETETKIPEDPPNETQNDGVKVFVSGGILGGLYSDSEDETVVKRDNGSFAISDINHMTEDISEEERSYTPCLDERATRQGLEGLDTEMISDEERNDFDESHELKTVSDGDALEINAKESELDFTRPEDYEEGEIVDKNKAAEPNEEKEPEVEKEIVKPKNGDEVAKASKKPVKKKDKPVSSDHDKSGNKENEAHNKESPFKKLSKNNKERNYRDKDKETHQHSPSKPKENREQNKKERKRERRKELERYSVRAIIAEKPPRPQIVKDQFGRDIRRTPTRSRSTSYTPPPIRVSPSRARQSPSKTRRSLSKHRSLSRTRKSASKDRGRKRRPSSHHRSLSRSRSRPPRKKRPGSKNKKRKRSPSRYDKRRKSRDRSKNKKKRSRSRHRSRSMTPSRRKREWGRREWTPTLSMSPSPEAHHMSPSWTPPKTVDNSQVLRNENLTVVLNNSNKKKKDKRRRADKRGKDTDLRQKKRRHERDRTPPPSKEVFASGDNILVSVSFNNDNETRDVTTRDRRKKDAEEANKKKKERRKNKNRRDLSGVKPVAIIDLERSPFKEITPSPKDIIVLSDSDNNDSENVRSVQKGVCDSSQQVASPERNVNYSTGPKTPPEPQVKFSLNPKPPQVRAISNPLHEPDDMEQNDDVQEDSRINEGLHKGPNTPPEPPNSPPSSPDAYDPFEPTKSRSPTPDPMQASQLTTSLNETNKDSMDSRSAIDILDKSAIPSSEVIKSLTPPIADIQPADSQSSIQATPESNLGKSPERIGVLINQTVQAPLSTSKPVAQTTPFSSVPTSLITSTPISSNLAPSRINILNSTIITPPHVASSIPQRIVLPNILKSSPVKIPPTKAAIKSTPIKPMPNKNNKSTARKSRNQNGSGGDDIVLDFDSPYSPGSSDYEDLFEPPSENIVKSSTKGSAKTNAKSPQKHQSIFDALFGSPNFNKSKNKIDKNKFGKKTTTPTKTKTVGVKLDEDNLKILDELPNSAVEMQVKDKFLKKLNRQERVVEEVKLVLKPHYNKKRISKEEYKDILRRSVPKICHNKTGEINPTKIKNLIEAYVKKIRHSKKVTSSSSVNPQKV